MIAKVPSVVVSEADILGGTPVFAGTRVPVDSLLSHIKAGDTIDTFLEDFPSVSRNQIEAFFDLTTDMIVEQFGHAHTAR